MARVLFFALLAMCLVCLIQCTPVPDQAGPTTVNPFSEIEAAVKSAVASAQKGFENLANDPNVKKIVEDAAKFVQQGADAVRQQAEKVIPKTE